MCPIQMKFLKYLHGRICKLLREIGRDDVGIRLSPILSVFLYKLSGCHFYLFLYVECIKLIPHRRVKVHNYILEVPY